MRIFLTIVLPFLLPTILYVVWLVTMRRLELAGPSPWRALPWAWLIAAGLVLTATLLSFISIHVGGPAQGTYVPPKYVDGRIVPGHVVPPDSAGH